jgi:amino acid adenylation domain-containing protein/non-ribosomal peptide synthase protein (TIGR01720 family)
MTYSPTLINPGDFMITTNKPAKTQNVEAIYPLSPMQQGMLFHAVYDPAAGLYFQQLVCQFTGALDVAIFQQAWQQVVQRHPILRTLFTWEKRPQPLQVVRKTVELAWQQQDWRSLTAIEQQARLASFLQADRAEGFVLSKAPLLRYALLQTANDTYQFVWSYHHLLIDGWSLPKIIQEVLAYYQAYSQGKTLNLPKVRSYEQYIDWLQKQDMAAAKAFWLKQLQGFTAPTGLPGAGRYPNFGRGTHHIQLSTIATNSLQAFARQHQLTLNTLVQAAWAVLLARYSGSSDILFGFTVSGRPPALAGVEDMVGLFINTLPLRLTVPEQTEILPWLQSIQAQQIGCDHYAYTPLAEIQGWSELPQGQALFNTLVVFENYPIDAALQDQASDLTISQIQGLEQTNFPLDLAILPGKELFIKMGYDASQYTEAVIEQLLGRFQHLLTALVEQTNLQDLSLLTPSQTQSYWQPHQGEHWPIDDIAQLFAEQVQRTPEAIAIIWQHEQITYSQLNARANQLAHYLQAQGVAPDVLVGICLDRSIEMVVGILGILKAGGAYLPIDPNYPIARQQLIVTESQVSLLLTKSGLGTALSVENSICLERDGALIAQQPSSNTVHLVRPHHLAYVLYTSGSTGIPKGVAIEQHSPAALIQWAQQIYSAEQLAGVLAGTSICFDLSVFEIFVPLCSGGSVILVENALALPQLPLAVQNQVTLINTVPTAISELLRQTAIPANVTTVNLAGEALPAHIVTALYQIPQIQQVWNLYGPSEDTTYSTAALTLPHSKPLIGRPITNTQAYVLDHQLRPLPIGIPGELYLGGAGLARGYYQRPALTAEKFISHPGVAGERLYCTGDLVQVLPDGQLDYLGRLDNQVKIRGLRIELDEIEMLLNEYPAINQAVVVANTDQESGRQRLVAYITTSTAPDTTDLRRYLQSKLPEYMVPSAFIGLKQFPLNANGKIDRKALPAPSLERTDQEIVSPRTAVEQSLTEIWSQTLGLPQVGIHDNFFELGGDSILSLQIIARANQAGLHLTPRQLFAQPTIATLAPLVGSSSPIVAQQGLVTGAVPLTPIQRWFVAQNSPEPHHFNQSVLLQVPCDLQPLLLEKVLQQLLWHHDALRLRFFPTVTGWEQNHADWSANIKLPVVDLSALSIEQQTAAIATVGGELQASLPIEQGPLIKAILFRLGGSADRLLIVVHHWVIDGVSWRILLTDLVTAYQQLAQGQEIALPPKTSSFQAWAERLIDYLPSLATEIPYWSNLSQQLVTLLPIDLTGGNNKVETVQTAVFTLDIRSTQTLLQTVPAVYHTEINDLLLTALAYTIGQWTGQPQLLLELEGHGRSELFADLDLTRTIGWFTSIFPVCLQLPDFTDWGAAILAVKEQLRSIPNQGVGYGLLRYLGDGLAEQLQCDAPISFNYLGQLDRLPVDFPADFRLASEFAGAEASPQNQRSYLWEINCWVAEHQLHIHWSYSDQQYHAATIQQLTEGFGQALMAVIEHCTQPTAGGYSPSDFPLAQLSSASLAQVLTYFPWRNVADIYPLSPMQQGMLFHSLHRPEAGAYIEVHTYRLTGELQLTAFTEAWQLLLDRHSILRTAFCWEHQAVPVQCVLQQVPLPIAMQDWQSMTAVDQETALQNFLVAEQQQGIAVTSAPLMRLTLIQLAPTVHQLVWTHHHLLLDGWSMPLVLAEVLNNYRVLCAGELPSSEAQRRKVPPYRNYIAWLQQQDLTSAANYWRQYLQGITTPTTLPISRQSVAEPCYRRQQANLGISLTDSLQAFAQKHQLTMNTLVQGAWALLLARYCGLSDVVFGATVSGRPPALPQVEQMVGLFINTLPVRVTIPEQQAIVPWLQQLQAQQINSTQYAYTPLVEIQKWSALPQGQALFETIVVFENFPIQEALQDQSDLLNIDRIQGLEQTNFPLDLAVLPGAAIELKISYDQSKFRSEDIQRLLAHLQLLLSCMVQQPDSLVSSLSLISPEEHQQLIYDWSNTGIADLGEQCIHELFAAQVARSPEAIAVICGDQQLTYHQLNARANQLADYLQKQGVKPESLVGLCLERSIDLIVSLWGILKAGGAYLPLDPNYPSARLEQMLVSSAATYLLTHSALRDTLPETAAPVICLDKITLQLQDCSEANPDNLLTPANLAYVIFTSGSTGTPKGVMVTQQNLVHFCGAAAQAYSLNPLDRVLQFSSISFDVAVEEIFPTLTQGATLYLRPPEMLDSVAQFLADCARAQLTVLDLPTAYWQQLTAELTNLRMPSSVRLVIIGGEKVLPHQVRLWQTQVGNYPLLINAYGPTETTVEATLCLLSDHPLTSPEVPIGRPLANVRTYILDSQQQPVPIGIPGELYIGGAGVARGYLHQPELTTERFVVNPFVPNERLYRTGDLVRYLPDGQIEYLGRLDEQVKIRGFRVELGEIENVLCQHPVVQQAVVILHANLTPMLVAYVVGKAERQDLQSFLQARLPEYMVPAQFVSLAQFPLTPSGKIDRKALPAPSFERTDQEIVSPRTAIEQSLTEIWSQTLGLPQVGIHDNFFELGGDSILSLQIIARANQAGLHLTPRQLFAQPTIATLAPLVGSSSPIVAQQGLVTGAVPLTPIQRWFVAQNFPEPHHFNQSVLLDVPVNLQHELLEQVCRQLLGHHDVLRLRFTQTTTGWQQTYGDMSDRAILQHIDLSQLAPSDRQPALEQAANDIQASLELDQGCLLRAALFTGQSLTDQGSNQLLLVVHHLAIDGVSWRILLSDLISGYEQLRQGLTITWPAKTTSFQQWAERLQKYTETTTLNTGYWQQRPPLYLLPIDRSEGENAIATTRQINHTLSVPLTQALLQEVPAAYRTQINEVLLTALAIVISSWTAQPTVQVNLEGHGREDLFADVDLSRTVGWFTTLFPVYLTLPIDRSVTSDFGDQDFGDQDLGAVLLAIKEQLRSIPNKGLDYGLWRYWGAGQTEQVDAPEIIFNYLGQLDQAVPTADDWRMSQNATGDNCSSQGQRSHLLEINCWIAAGQLHSEWAYSDQIHHAATIEQLANEFGRSLTSLIDHCLKPDHGGCTPSDFPLTTLTSSELASALHPLHPRQVTDLYPLSPMQAGMLFHSLYAPATGMYVEQLHCSIWGNLNLAALQQAWQYLAAQAVSRTALRWADLTQPLQIVVDRVIIPIQYQNWQHLGIDEQQQHLQEFLVADRQQGFDLTTPPLMRVHLVQLAVNHYQLIWSHHHVLLDGWSMPIILQMVFAAYTSFCAGEAPHLPAITPYRNYIAWLQQQDPAAAQAFWQSQLQDCIVPTPLPLEPALTPPTASGHQQQELLLTNTSQLQEFASQHQLTLNNLIQGAWGLLLSRHSGETDVVFGITMAGRSPAIAGVDRIVGLLINTLPLRLQLAADRPLLAWLQDIQAQQLEIEQYSYQSLAEIQRSCTQGRSLFESLVVFENYPMEEALSAAAGSLTVSDLFSHDQTHYPLTLIVVPGAELELKISYDASRFRPETIHRLLGHLQTILTAICQQPHQTLATVPLITAAETQTLLWEWPQSTLLPLPNCSLLELFAHQVAQHPQAVAVVGASSQLTYQELDAKSNQLARHLQTWGVGNTSLVAVCLQRSPDLIVSLLAILKTGAAYLPLNPSDPIDRLSLMVHDSKATVLLTQQALQMTEILPATICVDRDWPQIATQSATDVTSNWQPQQLAYVIYTSGSTGTPKGVMVSHQGLLNLLTWHQQAWSLTPADRTTQIAGLGFDATVWEIWPTLTAGATLYLLPDPEMLEPIALRDWLIAQAITVCFIPTPLVVGLLALPWKQTTALRWMLVGGDRLVQYPPADLPFQLANNYGPTENTVVTTVGVVPPVAALRPPAIGRPIANTQIYILNNQQQPVPIGVAGELYIGGSSLALGYLHRPELTTQQFVIHPWLAGEKLYRSGDQVRYLANGEVEYLGRLDQQVKLRGMRIELGEITTCLQQHPAIAQAIVVDRQDQTDHPQLVAYFVPQPEQPSPSQSELRDFLSAHLPAYMLPTAWVSLAALPLTSNGKVNRSALPSPTREQTVCTDLVLPSTPLETALAQIWSTVLGVEQVGIYDNFFELGGHSLLATQLVARIRTALQTELTLAQLFTQPTIAGLVAHWSFVAPQIPSLGTVVARSPEVQIPLSFGQQRLWFLHQLEPSSTAYHIVGAIKIQGNCQVDILAASLTSILARHEILRTTYHLIDHQPRQVVQPPCPWPLTVVDRQNHGIDPALAVAELLDQQQPFDLTRAPLVRSTLLLLSEHEQVLLFELHHIVADGWSMGILIEELAAIYPALQQQQAQPLPALTWQYADFALWQRGWLQGEVLQRQLAYWQQQLAGAAHTLALPTDRPRPAIQTTNGATLAFDLDPEICQALQHWSQDRGVTLFMTLLTAFNVLLHRYSGQDDILVGAPIANRQQQELENLIGFFTNTLVLRTDLSGNPSFTDLVTQVQATTLAAYAHQDLPLEMLVEALQPERDLSSTPLFQVMFVLHNTPETDLQLPGVRITPIALTGQTAKFDLTLSIEVTSEGWEGSLEYNTDLFDVSTIQRWIGHFQTLLAGIVATPHQQIGNLPLLTTAELPQPQAELSLADLCLHQLFEQQTTEQPLALAVVYEDQQLTYAELNTRANQLAHHLRQLGVQTGDLVGIYLERSTHLIVGMLGILKAGAAYLPLDPSYPTERLNFMLDDARVAVILSHTALWETRPSHSGHWVCLDERDAAWTTAVVTNLDCAISHTDLAYVIYTSGSTGQPKGVAVPHRAVQRLVLSTDYISLTSADRVAQAANAAFDAATFEIWGALLNGAQLVGLSSAVVLSPSDLAQHLKQHHITVLFLTTALFNQVVKFAPQGLEGLRYLLFGGEAVDPQWVRSLLATHPPQHLLHVYGPTENTTFSTWYPVSAVDDQAVTVPIGKAIANTQVYLLDRYQQPVPVGIPGEIYLGGLGLAKGYLHRPELTASKFVSDLAHPGHFLYRTGDLARYLPDGNIEYIARLDRQVKIRGFRIELGEIEQAILQHPAIQEVVVVAPPDRSGQLVAYIVSNVAPPTTTELRQFLPLPAYMLPSIVVNLSALPLTPNGKVDRPALPTPQWDLRVETAYVAPSNELEESIAQVWRTVLQLDQVGMNDNFFDLGGHSLLLVELNQRLQLSLARDISLMAMFEHPTVAALARHLAAPAAPVSSPQLETMQAGRQRLKQRRAAKSEAESN